MDLWKLIFFRDHCIYANHVSRERVFRKDSVVFMLWTPLTDTLIIVINISILLYMVSSLNKRDKKMKNIGLLESYFVQTNPEHCLSLRVAFNSTGLYGVSNTNTRFWTCLADSVENCVNSLTPSKVCRYEPLFESRA